MIRTRSLNDLKTKAARTPQEVADLLTNDVVPALSTLLTAWNRELIPGLVVFERLLKRITDHTVVLTDEALTIDRDTRLVLVDCTSGPLTVTLPAANLAWRPITVKKYDSSANAVTISPPAGSSIDGLGGASIGVQYETITVLSDGAQYWKI